MANEFKMGDRVRGGERMPRHRGEVIGLFAASRYQYLVKWDADSAGGVSYTGSYLADELIADSESNRLPSTHTANDF